MMNFLRKERRPDPDYDPVSAAVSGVDSNAVEIARQEQIALENQVGEGPVGPEEGKKPGLLWTLGIRVKR
jgi:hypothetical protein